MKINKNNIILSCLLQSSVVEMIYEYEKGKVAIEIEKLKL